jgi:hypothetical protein
VEGSEEEWLERRTKGRNVVPPLAIGKVAELVGFDA